MWFSSWITHQFEIEAEDLKRMGYSTVSEWVSDDDDDDDDVFKFVRKVFENYTV